MGRVKWGEAALAAIVGYEGDTILDSTGIPQYLGTNTQAGPKLLYPQSLALKDMGETDVTYGKVINKDLGFLAVAKVAYDVVKTGRLKDEDINIYLPYAIGTVFDASRTGASSGGDTTW